MTSWGSSTARAPGVVTSEVAGSRPCPQHQIILSGHQPVYLPGVIVMAKIALSDDFMFVGHCDYQPRSWHSRNYIRGYKSIIALRVPVIKKSGPSINEKKLDGVLWKDHHVKSIANNYWKRPFFNDYFPELEAMLLMPHDNLGDLNTSLIHLFCYWLNIETTIHYSQNWDIIGRKTAMLVDMCHKMRATDYLSSPGERAYVDVREMNGYAHHYLKFTHPIYEQGHREFVPNLSVIDLIFNCGPESGDIVRSAGTL